MTNQRPARMQRPMPGTSTITASQLIDFSKQAARLLEAQGEAESAFYFEQVAEWIQNNPTVGLNEKASKILGL